MLPRQLKLHPRVFPLQSITRDRTEKSMKMRSAFALLIGASLLLSACATVKGVGRDIESVGEAGSQAIDAK